jgi:uncharacterized OB-fold protein
MIDWSRVPLPDVADPDLAAYWEATRRQALIVRHCVTCDHVFWPPRPACRYCASLELDWRPAGERGRVFTWTVVGHTAIAGFREALPFAVAIVALDAAPGVRMVGRVISPPDVLTIDARVRVRFETIDELLTLPVWELE